MTFEAIIDALPLIAAAVSATVAAYVLLWDRRRRARRRTRDLNAVARAYEAHCAALTKILKDDELSEEIKDSLAAYSEAITRREVASAIVPTIVSGDLFRANLQANPFADELEHLRATRPEILVQIGVLVQTGTLIMFLRWPETSVQFQQLMAEMFSDGRREYELAARVSGIFKNMRNGVAASVPVGNPI